MNFNTILKSTAIIGILFLGLQSFLPNGDQDRETHQNALLAQLESASMSYFNQYKDERVFVETDKSLYEPGEAIWYSAFLQEETSFLPSTISDIVHVELHDPKGNKVFHHKIVTEGGLGTGDFPMDESFVGGQYKIKAYTLWQKNDGKNQLFEKDITVQKVILPRLKMKLDFEKKAYGPGEEVEAKLVLEDNENNPLRDFDFRVQANVEDVRLIEKTEKTDGEGKALIRFELPKTINTPDGICNVIIDYQGKPESIARNIPITLNQISMQLFPEGGELVEGIKTRVAFKALNEYNKPADFKAVLLDSKKNVVSTFSSFHNGMGAFELKPTAQEKYQVKIIAPFEKMASVDFPQVLKAGFSLGVDKQEDKAIRLAVGSSIADEELSIIGRVRGQVYYKGAIKAHQGINYIKVPNADLPVGIVQFTLFDSKGIERAERLVFANKGDGLKVEISTNKDSYRPREEIEVTVKTTDDRGIPVPANLSLSVVDDQLLSYADDKQGDILSKMFLEPELNHEVEEAGFYFDSKEEKADVALDFLLMTSGWRKFAWTDIKKANIPAVANNPEKASIAGVVYDRWGRGPVAGAIVKVKGGNQMAFTNQNGAFRFNFINLNQQNEMEISKSDFQTLVVPVQGGNQNMQVYLSGSNPPPPPPRAIPVPEEEALEMNAERVMMFDAVQIAEVRGAGPGQRGLFNKKATKAAPAFGNAKDKRMEKERDRRQEEKAEGDFEDDNKNGDNDQLDVLGDPEINLKDQRLDLDGLVEIGFDAGEDFERPEANESAVFYRSRVFPSPDYSNAQNPERRTDFRTTVYWKGDLRTDRQGLKKIKFFNNDKISSFKIRVSGFGIDGTVGRAMVKYHTTLPFSMNTKIPLEVSMGDVIELPVTLINNTEKDFSGELLVDHSDALEAHKTWSKTKTLKAKTSQTFFLPFKVKNKIGLNKIKISFSGNGTKDAFERDIKIKSKGFPVKLTLNGDKLRQKFKVNINSPIEGSIIASTTAYPSSVADLLSGLESILRQPSGCFEQTSSSTYPNIMVLQYMRETDYENKDVMERAENYIDAGYKRLTSFETSEKGYEWFGKAPAHEALTAFGLLEFNDMAKVYGGVSQTMVDRTAKYLMGRKDGKGGFKKNPKALDQFGRADDDITNAYIVYALTKAGYSDRVKSEFEESYKTAMSKEDPYTLALMSNAAYHSSKADKGDAALTKLLSKQQEDGSFLGDRHSITRSGGIALTMETTSLAALAMMNSKGRHSLSLKKSVEFLMGNRISGGYGNTQSTILALEALKTFSQKNKKVKEDGSFEVFVDGKKVGRQKFKAGDQEALVIDGLEKHLSAGVHEIEVVFPETQEALPYSVDIAWNTTLPNNAAECAVHLKTRLSAPTVKMGETVRLTAELKNLSAEGQPMTMAILGIPAGLTAEPYQLKDLQEKGIIDFYETKGNTVAIYFRDLAPAAKKEIKLDLKAQVPGSYESQASTAYLYYTNELKHWAEPLKIEVES